MSHRAKSKLISKQLTQKFAILLHSRNIYRRIGTVSKYRGFLNLTIVQSSPS